MTVHTESKQLKIIRTRKSMDQFFLFYIYIYIVFVGRYVRTVAIRVIRKDVK